MFRRDGADIHSDLFISIAQAILGGTARAQGLYETINVTVRARINVLATFSIAFFSPLKWKIADKWLEPVNNQHVGGPGEMRLGKAGDMSGLSLGVSHKPWCVVTRNGSPGSHPLPGLGAASATYRVLALPLPRSGAPSSLPRFTSPDHLPPHLRHWVSSGGTPA